MGIIILFFAIFQLSAWYHQSFSNICPFKDLALQIVTITALIFISFLLRQKLFDSNCFLNCFKYLTQIKKKKKETKFTQNRRRLRKSGLHSAHWI